ncbi:AAA family ATPase [Candidatus Bathyarchaeota archaeon]|nr:AAA family ATPase [Candidatus Bathyarchaeota archaeon]MBS7612908.1 AAA family ATPase [Candidatus Bathyarchaeota archaeon]MBS7617804.1 AAA family ATPase [Candidatus Bathyarchaeota archaeon]
MSMKICVAGKGGVGKTLVAGTLARLYARDGFEVLAVDADPNPNLAVSIGIPASDAFKITPLLRDSRLIEERTGTAPGSGWGVIFNIAPDVRDIVDRFSIKGPDGVKLLVVGSIDYGGAGCFCPETAFLKTLLAYIVARRREVVLVDLQAGPEPFGRGVAKHVDVVVVVTDQSLKSINTAERVFRLSKDLNVKGITAIINKVTNPSEAPIATLEEIGFEVLGIIPFDELIVEADEKGWALIDYRAESKALEALRKIYSRLSAI